MKKVISFGKIDYNGSGYKNCKVTVSVELKDEAKGKVLSICGDIWNPRETYVYSSGQNLDTISEYIKTSKFKKIYEIWKQYHLNDMHAGCIYQRKPLPQRVINFVNELGIT